MFFIFRRMEIIVNGLWIGDQLSPLELLCIKSFLDHGHSFHLWAYHPLDLPAWTGLEMKDANKILPEKSIFRYRRGNEFGHGKGSLAGFSDIFRYKLLWEKGGWWTDMDITCLKPLDLGSDYIFRPHDVLAVVGNLMKCPARSPLMEYCYKKAIQEVNADNTDWLKPIRILNEGIEKHELQAFIFPEISNPDRWEVVNYHRYFYGKKQKPYYIFHWMNEEWRAKKIKKNEVLKGSFLAQLMKSHEIEVEVKEEKPSLNKLLIWAKKVWVPLIPYPIRKTVKRLFLKNIFHD